jgi:AraC-like DNA-binding protein
VKAILGDNLKTVAESHRRMIDVPSIYMPESTGALFEFTPLQSIRNTGRYLSRGWDVEHCLFTEFQTDPFMVRKSSRQAANGEPFVFLHRLVRGIIRGRSGDLNVDRDTGVVYLLDQACQTECVQGQSTMQTVHIPKVAIGYNPDVHDAMITFPAWHPMGQILNRLFDEMFESLKMGDAYDQEAYAQLIACLTLALNTECEHSDVRRRARDALQHQICRHIEQNLLDQDLSANTLLRDFGLSRASLYRMFNERGGVRQYINERRLLRAVIEISKQPRQRGIVTQVANKWGFSSGANFNRSVKRRFGVPPGELVDLSAYDGLPPERRLRPIKKQNRGIIKSPSGYLNLTKNTLGRLAGTRPLATA